MSYILEALKKSESERGNTGTPTFQTVHTSSLQYQQDRTRLWPYLLAAVILLNVAVLGWLVFDKLWRSDSVSHGNAASRNESSAQPTQKITQVSNTTPISPAVVESTLQQSIATRVEPEPPRAIEPREYVNVIETRPDQPAPVVAVTTDAADKPVSDIYDLPTDIRNALPELNFSAHVYSTNPQQRSVVINGNFMEEGDMLTASLRVDEITADGVIFDYRGKRFRSSVVSGWSIN